MMSVLSEFTEELVNVQEKARTYEPLWQRYLELFKQNTALIKELKKGKKMDETLQTQDPLRNSMAEAHLPTPILASGTDGCEVSLPNSETPLQVEVGYIQTSEELTGTPVVI